MSDKSYVSMETNQCLICAQEFPTNNIATQVKSRFSQTIDAGDSAAPAVEA